MEAASLMSADVVEEWRPVPGYETNYQVSSLGRVRSTRRRGSSGGLLRIKIGKRGYPALALHQNNLSKTYEVHQLVALAFLGPRPDGAEVRHLDGDRMRPHLDNLAYGSRSDNNRDRVRHGTDHNARKTHCPQGHPYDEANTLRYPSRPTIRDCRTCSKERNAARYRPEWKPVVT